MTEVTFYPKVRENASGSKSVTIDAVNATTLERGQPDGVIVGKEAKVRVVM